MRAVIPNYDNWGTDDEPGHVPHTPARDPEVHLLENFPSSRSRSIFSHVCDFFQGFRSASTPSASGSGAQDPAASIDQSFAECFRGRTDFPASEVYLVQDPEAHPVTRAEQRKVDETKSDEVLYDPENQTLTVTHHVPRSTLFVPDVRTWNGRKVGIDPVRVRASDIVVTRLEVP